MKLGARYKQIGKKKFAVLDLPYDQVVDTFEDALCDSDAVSRLVGSLDRENGIFKIEYRISAKKKDVYESYCMLVQVNDLGDGNTKIEYVFVYDRVISWYTRLLSLICMAVPLAASAFVYFNVKLRDSIHLIFYIPLLLVSAFGLFSLFGYRERKSDIIPMVKEFEQMLVTVFDD